MTSYKIINVKFMIINVNILFYFLVIRAKYS